MPENHKPLTLSLDPTDVLAETEKSLRTAFKNKCISEINAFFKDQRIIPYSTGPVTDPAGAGTLLIQQFIEKKFDDPDTIKWMEDYYNNNFERIFAGAMEKAMDHVARKTAFNKALPNKPVTGNGGIIKE